MKKVCFLVDSLFTFGGVQCVTAVIAKALSASCKVTIVTFDPPGSKDTTMYGLDEADIEYQFFAYPQVGWLRGKLCKAYSAFYRMSRPRSQWASDLYARSSFPRPLRKALAEKLSSCHYDVIVGVHAPLAARLATIRSFYPWSDRTETCRIGEGGRHPFCIGWIHNSFDALFSPSSLYIGPQLRRHYLFQLAKLDRTIVLSHHDAREYTANMPSLHPDVIYNPLTLTPGQPSRGDSKRFLAVGRLSYLHKGFDLLISAFNIFARNDSQWTLHIVGEGPEEAKLRAMIAEYRLEKRVFIHPFTAHIQEHYSQAQVYVLSSRWEGFGLVLVEAMAHGLPVISSDLPTSREIMGDSALYFDVGDVEQLAQRLEEATHLDWSTKSHEAFSIARRFNTESIIRQWNEILAPLPG